MKERHQIAVRTLVEVVLRSGDLDMRFSAPGRPLEGIRAHQMIQRRRPEGYRAEVAVSTSVETAAMTLVVSGRIDGVLESGETTFVEEIKTTRRELAPATDPPDACHWGQAVVYACLLARMNDLPVVTVRLTTVHLDSGEAAERTEPLTRDALERFFADLVDRYLAWARTLSDWRRRRDEAIRSLPFPFPSYRAGQRRMAVTVYRTVRDGGQALIQASTGIGKTMAVLFPAIKTIADGATERLFFLTARNTGQASALIALDHLQQGGLRLKRVLLTAKDRICFCPEATCNPEACEYARGHFDRLTAAIEVAFEYDCLDRGTIEQVARMHRVCPFDLSLELSRWADCIVCDYNYAFDPRVYLKRFFEEETGAYAFLVDEAHNLVDRSRDMFSAQLTKSAFLELRRAVKSELPSVYRAAGKINTWMLQARRETQAGGGFQSEPALPAELEPQLLGFLRTAERWLEGNQPAPYRDLLLERYFEVNRFLRVWDQFDACYVTCRHAAGKEMQIKLFCLDPAPQLKAALSRARAAVFFSATMTPADYFQEILGCAADAVKLAVPSPFPVSHLGVYVSRDISTYYAQRRHSAGRVADLIRRFVDARKGNYLCFFPSYAYLEMVLEPFAAADPDADVVAQTPEMDDAGRQRFLDRFSGANERRLVGFAVMGGIFGEGIDLVGERLSGAVIVGVGLPAICPERELIRRHFDGRGRGFDFAYRYPGINRVLQAAGRVIRTETDRGTVLLADGRFCRPDYRDLLPDHWPITIVGSAQQLSAAVERFW